MGTGPSRAAFPAGGRGGGSDEEHGAGVVCGALGPPEVKLLIISGLRFKASVTSTAAPPPPLSVVWAYLEVCSSGCTLAESYCRSFEICL